MSTHSSVPNHLARVVLAFLIVYIVWGSTYFFIRVSLESFPPFMLGAVRFMIAGLILLAWALIRGERFRGLHTLLPAAVCGFLILFGELAIVFWVEQTVPSSFVSIMLSSTAIWFVLLDRPNWGKNFKSVAVLSGVFFGLAGIVLLFWENLVGQSASGGQITSSHAILLILAACSWATGSLYAKRIPVENQQGGHLNVAIQMLTAGICFSILMLARGETTGFQLAQVSSKSFWSMGYLITFGSIIAYSCYMWLLKMRPTTQVSTHVYVNPVVAVLLGVWLGREPVTVWQISGLIVILVSVMLINLDNYKQAKI